MRAGVVDVGANSVRLLVAERSGQGLERVQERKARLGLGAEIEARGRISAEKRDEVADAVRELTREARALGCSTVEVVVASPGRQASNASRLVRELAEAAGASPRVLTAEEEARLAYRGAVAAAACDAATVAVCDVGGGSTQVAIGEPGGDPSWLRSVDLGSLRLTARTIDRDPPGRKALAAARAVVEHEFTRVVPPLPKRGYAIGGSARALRRIVGPRLGREELEAALEVVRVTPASRLAARYGMEPGRAATVAAGAVIFAEVQRRLAVPLEVVRAGLREGVALSLLDELDVRPAAGSTPSR